MKKLLIAAAIAFGVLALVGAPSVAAASEECVPKDAWTETIEHPAVGNPTITIENPDYVPATEGHWVTDAKITKWVWVGGPVEVAPQSPVVDPTGWNNVGPTNDRKGRDNPDVVIQASGGPGNADWFFYQTTQTWVPGTDAVGDPTIEVVNPDYVAPWTETIQHEAVTCEPTIPEQPDPRVVTEQRDLNARCVEPLNGTAVIEHQQRVGAVEQVWDETAQKYVDGATSWDGWQTMSTSTVKDAACAKAVVVDKPKVDKPKPHHVDKPVVQPKQEVLAETGRSSAPIWVQIVVGLIIGIALGGFWLLILGLSGSDN